MAAVASAVSAVASTVGNALTKPPGQQGTVSEIMIGANMPVPYVMGRTYVGGNLIYDKSSNGPDNYDRHQVFVYSATAPVPIEEYETFLGDFSPIPFTAAGPGLYIGGVATGFYGEDGGYLWLDTRPGDCPAFSALPAPGGRDPLIEWGEDYKLSGYAASVVTMEFDEDGEKWASGIPQWGMIGKWVKVYDPRQDSSYPGGSGIQGLTIVDGFAKLGPSWAWSENPALHALHYTFGRWANGVRIVGIGAPVASIDIPAFVELANLCDANGWTLGGAVYEGPGISKWDNLKRILAAAAAEPVWVGGRLTLKISAPKVSLDTITADDLADGDVEARVMPSWKDRFNSIVPRYRSEAHKWEYVQAEAVTNATYLTDDGELKSDEIQFDLVQDVDQAAQLAAYHLVNRREAGPIRLSVKPRLMGYRPGEALTIDIPEAGLVEHLAVITSRTVDPATGSIQLTFESETADKHAYALGVAGTAPPPSTVVPPEDVDQAAGQPSLSEIQNTLRNTYPRGLSLTAVDAGTTATINLSAFTFDYPGTYADVAAPAGSITGLSFVTTYYVYADVDALGDTTPTYGATTVYGEALNSSTHPMRIFLNQSIETPADGGGTSSGGSAGGGYGGGGGGNTMIP